MAEMASRARRRHSFSTTGRRPRKEAGNENVGNVMSRRAAAQMRNCERHRIYFYSIMPTLKSMSAARNNRRARAVAIISCLHRPSMLAVAHLLHEDEYSACRLVLARQLSCHVSFLLAPYRHQSYKPVDSQLRRW